MLHTAAMQNAVFVIYMLLGKNIVIDLAKALPKS
jgi:hypothetical protein